MLFLGGGTAVAGVRTDVDTALIADAVGEDGVAVLPGAAASTPPLVAQVRRAADANIDLRVVVLPDGFDDDQVGLIAEDLQRQLAGTVLVLSPAGTGAASDSVGAARLSSALAAARAHTPDATASAAAFVGALDAEAFPWTLVWIAVGGALLLVIVVSTIRALRHRRTPPVE